jgi:hypothetical protein
MTRVHPVAQGGIDAKIGAKNRDIRKQIPVVMAVNPVLPPSAIPAPDSINAVTGEVPNRAPMEIQIESVQYAMVERGKSPDFTSTTPEKRAMLYSVAVQSMIST